MLNVSNKGIIDTRGQTAHQLFVTRMEAGDVSGTAYVSEWNLALNRAASADQRVFAVANGATLNLGDAQGIGSHLILRTGSEGDSGHSDIAVSELIAIKGDTPSVALSASPLGAIRMDREQATIRRR
ncbi:hypothetical protein O0544_20505 [Edwardsiella anguillarum]|nr:hypothetical protein [Edwardsiella anguillarum]